MFTLTEPRVYGLWENSLDPKAEFIFVPIERREEVVKTVEATPYDALRSYCRFKLLREKHKSELEKMDRAQQSDFLRRKMQEYLMLLKSSIVLRPLEFTNWP